MTVAVDTSVAVPLLVRSHHDHTTVVRWWNGQEVTLSGHALAETYSVLTRLPGDARLAPADAARLLEARFSSPLVLNDISGSLQAHTFSGSVEIHEARWRDPQTIDVDTFSGSVELRVPGDARGDVTFNSFSGRLESVVPLIMHSSSRKAVKAELGSGGSGSVLRVKTFSGSLHIDR